MTYRERRLAKADRLRGWAANREQQANAQLNSQQKLRHDWAFITQPGHIPERARMNARDDRAFESLDKAHSMNARAAGIEAAADKAIYSDDEDAPKKLTEKIALLERSRDHAKRINVAIRSAQRKNKGADAAAILASLVTGGILDAKEATQLARSFVMFPYHGLGYPAYHITNLGANIRRQKGRLAELAREKAEGPAWRYYGSARYESVCLTCEKQIEKGTAIVYQRGTDNAKHLACHQSVEVTS